MPFAIESYVHLGRDASHFLSDFGDIAASDVRVGKATFVQDKSSAVLFAIARPICTFNLRYLLRRRLVFSSGLFSKSEAA